MDIQLDESQFNLKLDATHSVLKMRLVEIKFDRRDTISTVK
jgi:hypothetical protein